MRKIPGMILILVALLVSGCAYQSTSETKLDTYHVYFLEAELKDAGGSDALRAEDYTISNADQMTTQELAQALMEKLLEGPTDLTLTNAIPSDTRLLGVEIEDGQALVDLSTPYNALSGVRLTLADYAITMTLTQLPGVLTTAITVRGQELAYRDQQTFAAWDVLRAPKEDVVSTLSVVLYFPNERGKLQSESRLLELYEGDTQAGVVAAALKEGPRRSGLLPVWPENMDMPSVWLKEQTCYVNLSTAALTAETDHKALKLALQALSQSLCRLESVQEVRFLVDGTFSGYYGSIDVSAAYTL